MTSLGGGAGLLANLAIANGQPAAVQTATAALQPGTTYNIVGFGQSIIPTTPTGAPPNPGLYAVVVRNSTNAVVYSRTFAVGTLLRWYRQGGEVSERQWSDIVGLIAANGPLDMDYLHLWAARLDVASLLEKARAAAPID